MHPAPFRRLALLAIATALACGTASAQPQMPPKQVGVVELRLEEVPRVVTLPGRAVAAEEAEIKPRVSGLVTEVPYRGGSFITAGTPMFRIDPTTYEARVTSAEAEVAVARAAAAQASSAYERASRLEGSGATRVDVENARSALDQAKAQVQALEAALDIARSELDWTTVTSPIDGMASVAAVSVGDLVTASQSEALATVTQLDPIDVDMYGPSAHILSVVEDIESGRLRLSESLAATLTLENGTTYNTTGELLAPGFTVSTSTGAVDYRFQFENPQRRLLPGMFVRGQVEIGTIRAFLVSQSAATRGRTGKLTAFVVVAGKVEERELTENGTWQHNWVVTSGVEEGDLLVADGFTGLVPGMEVVTVPVAYDEQGVVREVPAPASTAAPAPAEPADGPVPDAAAQAE